MDRAWLHAWEGMIPVHTPKEAAEWELAHASEGAGVQVCVKPEMGEAYCLRSGIVEGGETGVLQGAFQYLASQRLGKPLPQGMQQPCYALRMLNCWDNMDGSIERGYSGPSLWFSEGRVQFVPQRIQWAARLLSSCGVNVVCINNVNVREPAQELIDSMLPDVASLAALFRAYGIRLMLSVDFSHPLRNGLPTADPLDARVQAWWRERARRVYEAIPDLAGFLVKADSEHRPGPFTYGRNHAEGANMLASAIAPFGGVLIWRAFVYNCQQDWRDQKTDRPMAAYQTYMPLDGCFSDNVILQVKHGPFDFQVREPLSPLLLGMQKTHLCLEVQLAQEYTGHQIDLYTMPPMWAEVMEELPQDRLCAVCAVGNLGSGPFLTGHPLAAVNLYAFGRFGWQPHMDVAACIRDWVRLSYALSPEDTETLCGVLLKSRAVYESYTGSLGLCWMVTPGFHYGPSPMGYEYDSWGTYHRADRNAVGIDRTEKGTGYVLQYPAEMQEKYGKKENCPDTLLLFFHRMRYTDRMRDGRTVIQRLYDDHFDGAQQTREMQRVLQAIPFPAAVGQAVNQCMEKQVRNAQEWCDVSNSFFHRLSGIEDEKGRIIYD